jgi:hypothetical protein
LVEPSQRQVDESVEESMDLFERAKVGTVPPVEPQRPHELLLVLDGSGQDGLAVAIAQNLHQRLGPGINVLDAREMDGPDELAERTAESLGVQAVAKPDGSSFDQILDAAQSTKADLVIVPCPYQRDLDSVGPDSAGTVIDVLAARSPVPLLVVRKPFQPQGDLFPRARIVLTRENEAAPAAAAWAVGLAAAGASLRLVLVLEEEFYQNLKAVMPTIAPGVEISHDALSNALAKTHVRLHRSLQKAAAEAGFGYQLAIERHGEAGAIFPADESAEALIVLPLERPDHASQGFVQEQIRLSPHTVLVVPKD